jgi:hypothetical protein
MPTQDAYGRWISDDGGSWWDGAAWRPVAGAFAMPIAARRRSPWMWVGIGCLSLFLLVVLVVGGCTALAFLTPTGQQQVVVEWNTYEAALQTAVSNLQNCEESHPGSCSTEITAAQGRAGNELGVAVLVQAPPFPDCAKQRGKVDQAQLTDMSTALTELSRAGSDTTAMTRVSAAMNAVAAARTQHPC